MTYLESVFPIENGHTKLCPVVLYKILELSFNIHIVFDTYVFIKWLVLFSSPETVI